MMNTGTHPEASTADGRAPERGWVPLAALVFGILAVVALTAIPVVLLQRIVTRERITMEVLPAYGGLKDFAFAMEQRIAAARSGFLAADPRYDARLAEGVAAEAAALKTLELLAPRLAPRSAAHVESLRRLVARRDSVEALLVLSDADMNAYLESLPQFDLLRDSMLVHVDSLMSQLTRVTEQRVAEEALWARQQRSLSAVLGVIALLAAAVVAWFGWVQRRLRRQIQHALDDATRARAEAERRREALERVTESRTRLMRGFSHDVKNPLGAACGYLDLMRDGVHGHLNEKQAHSVTRASASIKAALSLVEDLLELARAESGTLDVVAVPTDLTALVRDVVEEYRAQAEGKGLELDVQVPAALPPVTIDGKRVRQVLGNLISNAVKYTQHGRVIVHLTGAGRDGQSSRGGPAGQPLGISVSDTGPGIPAEQQHLLFEEFVRLDPQIGNGAGVGLAISHHIAQALGGRITVQSEVGRGSQFTLWLP
ncbi:MAG: HAMP domain-containing sensor histidine kinase [Gemmatimonadota bacterium]